MSSNSASPAAIARARKRRRRRLTEKAGAEVELVKGHGGVFEITVDGALKFSKKAAGRFPSEAELDAVVK